MYNQCEFCLRQIIFDSLLNKFFESNKPALTSLMLDKKKKKKEIPPLQID